jgi:hypothetical protein
VNVGIVVASLDSGRVTCSIWLYTSLCSPRPIYFHYSEGKHLALFQIVRDKSGLETLVVETC